MPIRGCGAALVGEAGARRRSSAPTPPPPRARSPRARGTWSQQVLAEGAHGLAGRPVGDQRGRGRARRRASQIWRTRSAAWVTSTIVRPSRWNALDAVEALALERLVADREHLVDEEDVGVDVDGDREPEPHVHARRVVLHLLVDELLELGEVDDLVEDARRSPAASKPRIEPLR